MKKALVAGSICMDIIPVFSSEGAGSVSNIFAQGKYNDMKGTRVYLGGCVGNTGIAMHKLGVPTTLYSKVGDDLIGSIIRMILDQQHIPIRIDTVPGMASSSTVVVAPPGTDRVLLHSRGASQTFVSDDIDEQLLLDADLMHFAYPTAMKYLYANEGAELIRLVRKAKATGVTVSIDTTLPDPNSEPGRVNWRAVLEKVLPSVDIFVPSLEELIFMLHRDTYNELVEKRGSGDMIDFVDFDLITGIAEELLAMGSSIVLIKIGKKGVYLRTADEAKLRKMGRAVPDNVETWAGRELLCLPYKPEQICSTTGAGDNAIAGFLASFLRSDMPEHALELATANAKCCIESFETTEKIVPIEELDAYTASGPAKLPANGIPMDVWTPCGTTSSYYGRLDPLANRK